MLHTFHSRPLRRDLLPHVWNKSLEPTEIHLSILSEVPLPQSEPFVLQGNLLACMTWKQEANKVLHRCYAHSVLIWRSDSGSLVVVSLGRPGHQAKVL